MKYVHGERLIDYAIEITLKNMIYKVESDFWEKIDEQLIENLKECVPDTGVSMQQGISNLLINFDKIAKERHIQKQIMEFPDSHLIKVSLGADPIISYIDKTKGTISISTPNIRTKHFDYRQWRDAIQLVKDYLNVGLSSLEKEEQLIYDKYFLNAKTTMIVISSIKAVCRTFFQERGCKYKIENGVLYSIIIFGTLENIVYRLRISHKAFSQNPDLLKNFLDNPHEEEIPDVLICRILKEKIEL